MPGPYSSVYSVVIVDAAGTRYAELVNATITSVQWELNGWGNVTFSVPTNDPHIGECKVVQREAQVWYDPLDGSGPKCLSWGPIVRARATPLTVEFQAAQNPLWYLNQLYFGPVLTEYITNGDFESGTTGWTAGGTVTMTVDGAFARKASNSLKLVSSAQGLDNFASVSWTITAGAQDVAVFVASDFYLVATGGSYIGPAFQERGLFVQTVETAVVQKTVWTPIDNSAPRNQWVRIYAPSVSVPAGHTQTVTARCYSPGGTIRWDMVTARVEESTGGDAVVPGTPVDVTTIVANVVAYAQSSTANKPNLHLTGPSGTFGVSLDRQYQFYGHGKIWDTCFKELIDSNVCDVDVVWSATNPTTRTVTLYSHKGSTKPQLTLELGANVGDYTYDHDGTADAAAVTVLGQGFSQEQRLGTEQPVCNFNGYAVDTSALGGITLQSVQSVPPETPPDGVANKATTELARTKNGVTLPTVVTKENLAGSLIGVLQTGDTVPFIINDGWVQENTSRRVVGLVLDPATDTLTVTGN